MKKVLIADDHAIFREGLKQVIDRIVDMFVADEAESGQEALRKVQTNDYDLLILDISMPGRNGLDVLADIKRAKPKLPVLILSMHPEEQYALRSFKVGASGYLTKGSSSQELMEALQKVALGKRYISASLAEALANSLGGDSTRSPHEELSIREYQVMCLIAAGNKPQQIAEDLAMSVKTVGTYRVRILKKMNMKSNAELTRYALENGLIERLLL
ncbi:MAG: two component LuxR family transcriptional [Geobacteraceae bacterium]|nr:MAG: two component LuxR family transcriptional [Geobacteraceae bacterium]